MSQPYLSPPRAEWTAEEFEAACRRLESLKVFDPDIACRVKRAVTGQSPGECPENVSSLRRAIVNAIVQGCPPPPACPLPIDPRFDTWIKSYEWAAVFHRSIRPLFLNHPGFTWTPREAEKALGYLIDPGAKESARVQVKIVFQAASRCRRLFVHYLWILDACLMHFPSALAGDLKQCFLSGLVNFPQDKFQGFSPAKGAFEWWFLCYLILHRCCAGRPRSPIP